MTTAHNPARPGELVLDDGTRFTGRLFGADPENNDPAEVTGAVEFSTDMFGYQSRMTAADNAGTLLVMATPHIGNVGWKADNAGNNDIQVAALIVRDLSYTVADPNATSSLEEEMRAQGIIGLKGVDTRRLVRHLSAQAAEGKQVRGTISIAKRGARK